MSYLGGFRVAIAALAVLAACSDEAPPAAPAARDAGTSGLCDPDHPCGQGFECRGGVCEAVTTGDPDAAVATRGAISIDPLELSFGAFLLGVPVERSLTVTNRGSGELELLAVEIERNTGNEFELLPGEDLPHLLAPGESTVVRVRYTARDGLDDLDRLRVISDDPDAPITIVPLIAEYKGVSDIAVVRDPATAGPELQLLDFGAVPLGSSRTLEVFVKNVGDGNAVLEVSAVRTEPNPSLLFSIETSSVPPVLLNRFRPDAVCDASGQCTAPGTTCSEGLCVDASGAPLDTVRVRITFTPSLEGAVEELLVVANDDGGGDESPYLVRLTGAGIRAALEISADPIDLGTIFVGFPRSTSVTLTSAGDDVLRVEELSLSGAPAGFELDLPLLPPFELPPGATFDFEIIGDPLQAGPVTGVLHVVSTDPQLPVRDVALIGDALEPPVAVTSSTTLAFGQVHVFRAAGQFTEQPLQLSSAGGSPLSVVAIGFTPGSSPDFTIVPGSVGSPLDPGQWVDFSLRYAPRNVGTDTATLTLTTNDPLRPRIDVVLSGEGTDPTIFLFKSTAPPIPASPIDFGAVYRGSMPPPVVLTVQNTGVGDLIVESLALGAGSSADFTLGAVPALPFALAPQASLQIEVRYAPAAVGTDSGAISIGTSDRDAPLQMIALAGEAVGCPANRWDLDQDPANGCEYACVQRVPAVELCNGQDDDCDGVPDEGFDLGQACDGVGQCGAGTIECVAGDPSRSTCSTNPGQPGSQAIAEICNTLDDDCDGTPDDGFDLQNDTGNCGVCGRTCTVANGAPLCTAGTCRVGGCNTDFADCNNSYADGCESDLRSDTDDCGVCNRACVAANGTPQCTNRQCRISGCNAGFFDCNAQYADGCEANLLADVGTCGSCVTQCTVANGTPLCATGQCAVSSCVDPWENCNGLYGDGCEVNTDSSLIHCGGCNAPCTVDNGTPTCSAGSCAIQACTAPFDDCNQQYGDGCEVDTNTSSLHCGACGNACALANASSSCNGSGACRVDACNGAFRDCNLLPVDGCEVDTNTNLAHCGGCNVPCDLFGATESCNTGTCTFGACQAGFVNLDGNPANGCEYQCTAQPGLDLPDDLFIDSNCDGIDGDRSVAIFVSPLGSDAASGQWGAPVRTIQQGFVRAQSSGRTTIFVAAGFYSGIVDLVNGVSVYGGYDPGTWARSFSNNAVISGGASGNNLFGVRAQNINLTTVFDGLVIDAGNNTNASGSVYGLYASNAGASLSLRNLTITTGRAGDGNPGTPGQPGATGGSADPGQTGCDGCSSNGFGGGGGASTCGRPGGSGGRGGYDNANGAGGVTPAAGGAGGGAGEGADVCINGACSTCAGRAGGGNGTAGQTAGGGSAGPNGAAGSAGGTIIGGLWNPGAGGSGTSGTPGAGGGGGGGGGGGANECDTALPFGGCVLIVSPCNSDRGGGGGGGGAGGCGGNAGLGGGGGGGSFGIFLVSSSPRIERATINAGRGGNGGSGGRGGDGGLGGMGAIGGFGPDDAGNGGAGAPGLGGGRGGHGGGGAGGASFGIYRVPGSTPVLTSNTITAGGGGAGGGSLGNPGQAGASGTVF